MRALAFLVGLMLTSLPAAAQAVGAEEGDSRNAATWYRRAFAQYHAVNSAMTDDQRTAIENFTGDPSGLLTPEVRQLMVRYAPVIEQVNRAASMPTCEFGGAEAGDPFAPREHLADMRRLARLLHYDMMLRMCDGDENTAVDRTATVLRLGDQIAQDDPLISHLVGAACFALGGNMVHELADGGLLSAQGAARLLPIYQRANPQDPFGYRQGLKNLSAETHWLIQQLETEPGRAKLIEHADWFVGEDIMAQWQLAGASPDKWRSALEKAEALSKRISAVFDEPDVQKMQAALSVIDGEIKRGDHGPLAEGLFGFCRNMPVQMEAMAKLLNENRRMLESVASGAVDPKTLANAAALYLRAIGMINAIDRKEFAAIRQVASDVDRSNIDESVGRCLDESQPIIDLLRQASLLKTCDFQLWGPINRSHPGMRDAARLLHADAARLMQAKNTDQAADRLEIALRMAGQLARQREVMFSLIAQAVVNRSGSLVTSAIAGQGFSDEQMAGLSRALDGFRENDPFGLTEAVSTSREQWRQMFGKDWTWEKGKDSALIKRATEFVNQCTGDDFFWFSVAQQEALKDFPWYDHAGASGYAAALNDIIDLNTLIPALSRAQTIRTIIDHNDFDRLADLETPEFCHIEQRMKNGVEDYRRLRHLLPRQESPATLP